MLACALSAENVTLCYHKFSYSLEDLYATMPDVLEWQIKYLKNNHVPILRVSELEKSYYVANNIGNNVVFTVDDGWKSLLDVLPIMTKENVPMTFYLYPGVIYSDDENYIKPNDLLTLKANPLVEFGCHSYTHPVLTKCSNGRLNYEVIKSKEKLEQALGIEIDTFAYPYGMFNSKVKNLCRDYYKLIFGVNDGSNNINSDKYNLNRYVIYKNTTFGEFMAMIAHIKGDKMKLPYTMKHIGFAQEYDKYFQYTRVLLYKFPPVKRNKTVIIIPGSDLGAGWAYKIISGLNKSGFQSYVMVNRNNNIPFYREDDIAKVVKEWGLKEFTSDIKDALFYISGREQGAYILTWGDGFDQTMAALATTKKFNNFIKGIITINPSISGNTGDRDFFRKNVFYYDELVAKGESMTEDLKFFLKVKTLSDLMVLKPEAPSPFSEKLGYGKLSNKDTLKKVFDDEDHPDLGIDYQSKLYTLDDFRKAFMIPLPLFSMIEPMALVRDINYLWYEGFTSDDLGIKSPEKLAFPVSYYYTDSYAANVTAIKNLFKGFTTLDENPAGDIATIELLLSNNTWPKIIDEVKNMASGKPVQAAMPPEPAITTAPGVTTTSENLAQKHARKKAHAAATMTVVAAKASPMAVTSTAVSIPAATATQKK